MMEPDYKSLIQRIKEDRATDEDYRDLFSVSHKRLLSALITTADADWLIALGESRDTLKRSCARTLMRNIANVPKISAHLHKAWGEKDLSDDDRNALLWRVLDDPDLPTAFHGKIWGWVKNNRQVFNDATLNYLKPCMEKERKTLNQVMAESLVDTGQPNSKRWIYVAAAVLGADSAVGKGEAAELLDRGLKDLPGTYLVTIESELRSLLAQEVTP